MGCASRFYHAFFGSDPPGTAPIQLDPARRREAFAEALERLEGSPGDSMERFDESSCLPRPRRRARRVARVHGVWDLHVRCYLPTSEPRVAHPPPKGKCRQQALF